MTDPAIKTSQHPHQVSTYLAHRDDPYYALWWEMGLGKTKEFLDVASHLFLGGKIDGLLIVAPNAVAPNWLGQECPPHLAAPYIGMHYRTKKSASERSRLKALMFLNADQAEWKGRLRVLTMSYNSLLTDRGYEMAKRFVSVYRTMIVADESTAIKNNQTKTAKRAKEIRALCHYAWIGTGTPVADKPFDAHSQIEFLNPNYWVNHGLRSKEAFKQEFGRFILKHVGGGKKVAALDPDEPYRRLDYLQKLLEPVSSRLLKEDSSVRLPPKMYTTRSFRMHPAQVAAYEELREEYTTLLDTGEVVDAPLAITRLIRLQQITSGFVTAESYLDEEGEEVDPPPSPGQLILDDPEAPNEIRVDEESRKEAAYEWFMRQDFTKANVAQVSLPFRADEMPVPKPLTIVRSIVDVVPPEENPRLALLLELLEEAHHKVIVWCKFRHDVDTVCKVLGDACVRYDGKVKQAQRAVNLALFREAGGPRIFVANPEAISMGVTLVIAKTVIYYSNTQKPEKRLQSEDRSHRIGQDVSVQIIDIVAEGTIDLILLEAHLKKFRIAAMVTADRYREWINLSPRKVEDDDD